MRVFRPLLEKAMTCRTPFFIFVLRLQLRLTVKRKPSDGLTRTKASLNFSMRNQIAEGSSQWPSRVIIESRVRCEQGEDARLMRRKAAPNL